MRNKLLNIYAEKKEIVNAIKNCKSDNLVHELLFRKPEIALQFLATLLDHKDRISLGICACEALLPLYRLGTNDDKSLEAAILHIKEDTLSKDLLDSCVEIINHFYNNNEIVAARCLNSAYCLALASLPASRFDIDGNIPKALSFSILASNHSLITIIEKFNELYND